MTPLFFGADSKDSEQTTPQTAFIQLFEAWRQRVYNYAVALGVKPEVAEELVQEAFLRLIAQLNRGHRPENVPGWLFRVTRNLIVDRARARSKETPIDDFDFERLCDRIVDPHPSAEQNLLDQERMKRLHAEIRRLTAHQREALFLRAEGFRHREIGEIMRLAPSTVSDLLRRAIRCLTRDCI